MPDGVSLCGIRDGGEREAKEEIMASLSGNSESCAPGLPRVLTAKDIAFLTAGTAIGSGVFLVPGLVLRNAGTSITLALALWIGGGILSLLGALTYAELGADRAGNGGLYAFLRDSFGRPVGFLFGWAMFVVIGPGTVAALAVAFATYAGALTPVSPFTCKGIAALLILTLVIVNLRSTSWCARLQGVITIAKVAGVALMVVALVVFRHRSWEVPAGFQAPGIGARSFALAIIGVLWTYEGWQHSLYLTGETRDPKRTLPTGLAVGTLIILATYLAANLGYLAALGPASMAGSERTATEALAAVAGPKSASILCVLIMLATLSAAHGNLLSSSRIFYAMAEDGLFLRSFRRIDHQTQVPYVSVIATGVWASVLAFTGSFTQLLSCVISVGWAFYGLSGAAIFKRRRVANYHAGFSVPGYPWTPAIFVASAVLVAAYALSMAPGRFAVGLGIVLSGLGAYRARKYLKFD
jgi:basic amino acid/polyamine antiporter, APA family